MSYSIAEVNQMTQAEFESAFGAVFENTPKIALEAWLAKPFNDAASIHESMVQVAEALSPQAKLELICSHPDLGSKVEMAQASVNEQKDAGLDQLSSEEYGRFQHLNCTYQTRFGFPFIIAVKNLTKDKILTAFEQRLGNSVEQERIQAFAEICFISYLRLQALVH